MANVDHLVKKEKLKVAVIEFALELRRVMLTVPDLQKLRSVKIPHVQTHSLAKSGNAAAPNLWQNKL